MTIGPRPRLPADFGSSGIPSPLNERTVDRLLRMVDNGAGPREVAAKFQVDVRTVGRWRRLLGFTWISRPDSRRERLRELWPSDLTMDRLGEELGVSKTTVRRWANDLGLRRRAPRRRPSVESIVRPELRRMVRQGLGDEEIAGELGLALSTVATYRRHDGWVYRSGRAVDPDAVERLFRKDLSDDAMAAELGISVVTVRQHRHRLRLLRGPARR